MAYFGVRISIVCLSPGAIPEDGYTQDIQVHIVKASTLEAAFDKACDIGKREENSYLNSAGEEVRWRFRVVEAITALGDDVVGKEVSSRMEGWRPSSPIERDAEFTQALSDVNVQDESTT